MKISRSLWHGTALLGLGVVVGLVGFLMTVQALLVALAPGTWHWPAISKVTIQEIDQDPQSNFTDIRVKVGEAERTISLRKEERAALSLDDEVWILDNYFVSRMRPPQFLLTPQRLLLEFPEPLLLLALLGIWRVRKAQAKAKAREQAPDRTRTVIRDDFHTRAQRFAAPKDPENPL